MPKTFKQFRDDDWDGNEWESDDGDRRSKDLKLQSRRDQRKKKVGEKYSAFDEREE
jgi:hypothetical protein